MAKKVIMFLSPWRKSDERKYTCPDSTIVTGAQTYEAPLRYLFGNHPDIDEIICIVSTGTKGRKGCSQFQKFVEKENKSRNNKVKARIVAFPEDSDFVSRPLPSILGALNQDDEILLETSGGPRNAIMYIFLLSRVLSFSGHPTVQAVYANMTKEPYHIEDVSQLFNMLDLIGGMQDLMSFGQTGKLKDYYQSSGDSFINSVITNMDNLSESISLCQISEIDKNLQAFNKSLSDSSTCKDPLVKYLLPTFKARFGEELDTKSLIEWCVENDRLQEALTVYVEKIPQYLKEKGLLTFRKGYKKIGPQYKDEYEDQFNQEFLLLCETNLWINVSIISEMKRYLGTTRNVRQVNQRLNDPENISVENDVNGFLTRGIINLRRVAKAKYIDKLSRQAFNAHFSNNNHLRILTTILYEDGAPTSAERFLNRMAQYNGANADKIYQNILINKDGTSDERRIDTIERLDFYIKGSGYSAPDVEKIKTIARDYLYIKNVRNTIFHANDRATKDQEPLMEYLIGNGYPKLVDLNAAKLKEVILAGMKNLE